MKITILSKYIISIQILLSCITIDTFAQRSNHFGLDLSKTLLCNGSYQTSGFIIEPVYLHFNDTGSIKFKLPLGFSSIKRDNIYSNSNIKTTGYYIKPGIGFSRVQWIVPYVNLLLTNYTIKNKYVIKGNYFGDYIGEYTQDNLFALGIESNLDLRFRLQKQFSLIFSFRLTYIIYNSASEDFPVHYIPGAGILINEPGANRDPYPRENGNVSGGINVYLVWSITKPNTKYK